MRCFDSNVIIDSLNGVQAAQDLLATEGEDVVSVVTWIEVLAGCRDEREDQAARALLGTFRIISLDGAVAEETVRLRKMRRLKLPDAAVLATASALGCGLITRNTKDFAADDPLIHIPYQL